MTIQPTYHWQFDERKGNISRDVISGIESRFHRTISWDGHGRIGSAVRFDSRESRIVFGPEVGQFGTRDFTVAFGIKIMDIHGQDDLDIIGTRSISGHGNWFSLRLEDKGRRLTFAVDENSKGKHHANTKTPRLSNLFDKKWHHIALVREDRTVKIYFDGTLMAEGASKTGVANINRTVDVKLGHYTRHTPTAHYEDLRIYHTALSDAEIQSLVPPVNRPLSEGEIELVATDGAAVIFRKDVKNLSRFSQQFQTLRVGPDTRVSLFSKANFSGTGQRVYADLPDIRQSRLNDFPASVRIRSAIGEPFTGKWLIKAPNGQFLNLINAPFTGVKSVLITSPKRSFNAFFKLQQQSNQSRIQLIHDANKEHTLFRVAPRTEAIPLFVEELRPLTGEFSIVNQAKDQWLEMGEKNTFKWTDREEKRAVFARVAKMADHENQVGELAPGEVALYQHVAYHGRTWILSDTEKDLSGEYPDLSVFQSLQDETSSIRLGPETGVTVFREDKFRGSLEEKPVRQFDRARRLDEGQSKAFRNIREKVKEAAEKAQEAAERAQEATKASLVEDIVENAPNLFDSQIGDDTISSIKIFRTVEPEDVFTSYTTKLSQDYKMVGNQLEEFSAYRTTLRFAPGDRKLKVEVSATDLTKIEVEGTVYKIDESRSVTLSPNAMNRIMITSEADGINTPGLKIRTSAMAANEHVVIFPNQAAHQQIAELEEGALWNAKDAQGNFIVDREAHSQAEVASVQNTIKRVMATVAYADETSESQVSDNQSSAKQSNVARARAVRAGVARLQGSRSRVKSTSRVVSGATIDQSWKIEFGAAGNTSRLRFAKAAGSVANERDRQNLSASTPKSTIQETEISQDEFAQLLSRAIPEETSSNSPGSNFSDSKSTTPNLPGPARFIKIGNPFKTIGDAIKSGASATIGFFEDAVNILVDTAQGVFRFVVDTVEKVAEFVEAVVEKVVESIKQFIEFLQFLFDWGDILDTQRYLKRAINTSLDSAKQLAVNAKPHVKTFVDDLQDGVEDGMNQLVEKLGGKPSEVEESGFEMPEELEWFLDKFLGGSKSSDSEATSGSGSGDSPLASFVRQMLEAFEDAIGAGLRLSEGMSDSIQALIANPREPEVALIIIIEALRDAIIQSLDAVENVALGLLDVVGLAIDLFKDLLNKEIRIPFISDLLDFIGVGKLTVLNLATIVLAIPVTITAKLVTGQHLFASSVPMPLDLANQTGTPPALASVTTKRSVRADSTDASRDSDSTAETDEPDSLRDLRQDLAFTTIVTMADTTNHLIALILDLADIPGLDLADSPIPGRITPAQALEVSSLVLSLMSWSFSYPAQFEASDGVNEEDRQEIILWSYRGGTLAIDTVLMIANNFERMRRVETSFNVMWALLNAIDMSLFSLYLAAVEEENDRIKRANISSEVFSALPNVLCFLRSIAAVNTEPLTSAALHLGHAATNVIAAHVTMITGGILIKEANKALKEAKAAT
ncbi:MAG: LamG-like jellyroll fold domain-containing protein [Cyanobacteria bacterium P01_H01_bin.21]